MQAVELCTVSDAACLSRLLCLPFGDSVPIDPLSEPMHWCANCKAALRALVGEASDNLLLLTELADRRTA